MTRTRSVLVGTGLMTFGLISAALTAGPLDPPAGPVAPTFKTLAEVEPRIAINSTNTPGDANSLFKITQRGSYYLTGNITGVSGKHGIEIAANGVSIDLAGFELLGASGSLDAISDTVDAVNVHVRNGSIRNWGAKGVDCTTTEQASIVDVAVRDCTGVGISLGRGGTVTRCTASSNGGGGIAVSVNSVVSGCSVELNPVSGIVVGAHSRVVDCVASGNPGDGIVAFAGSSIAGCAISGSGSNGITALAGCSVLNCSVSASSGTGISVADGCTVTSCTSSGNGFSGIAAATACVISGCSASGNAVDGIAVGNKCLVTGNHCGAGSGTPGAFSAGIHVGGNDNRIEGNLLSGNARGLQVDSAGNIIMRNVASGNTLNWEIAAGNFCLVVQGIAGGFISGNAGGTGLGSTDPNANFTY